jgi:hypothetical protein
MTKTRGDEALSRSSIQMPYTSCIGNPEASFHVKQP